MPGNKRKLANVGRGLFYLLCNNTYISCIWSVEKIQCL